MGSDARDECWLCFGKVDKAVNVIIGGELKTHKICEECHKELLVIRQKILEEEMIRVEHRIHSWCYKRRDVNRVYRMQMRLPNMGKSS